MISLGEYEYDPADVLGSGAFAIVYKGRLKNEPNKLVAIKRMHKRENTSKSRALLNKEISVLKGLKHENIVQLYTENLSSNGIFLVMEYCNGGDLADYLQKKHTLSEDTIQSLLNQIGSALSSMNEKGILHRDLKPGNILLDNTIDRKLAFNDNNSRQKIKFKLADFGFARFLQEGVMAATLCGSPMYMAPEVLMCMQYNGLADIWSLGIIVYQCATGRAPFIAQTPEELRNIYAKTANLRPRIPESMSPTLKGLLLKMLVRLPAGRIGFKELMAHPFVKQPDVRIPSEAIPVQRRDSVGSELRFISNSPCDYFATSPREQQSPLDPAIITRSPQYTLFSDDAEDEDDFVVINAADFSSSNPTFRRFTKENRYESPLKNVIRFNPTHSPLQTIPQELRSDYSEENSESVPQPIPRRKNSDADSNLNTTFSEERPRTRNASTGSFPHPQGYFDYTLPDSSSKATAGPYSRTRRVSCGESSSQRMPEQQTGQSSRGSNFDLPFMSGRSRTSSGGYNFEITDIPTLSHPKRSFTTPSDLYNLSKRRSQDVKIDEDYDDIDPTLFDKPPELTDILFDNEHNEEVGNLTLSIDYCNLIIQLAEECSSPTYDIQFDDKYSLIDCQVFHYSSRQQRNSERISLYQKLLTYLENIFKQIKTSGNDGRLHPSRLARQRVKTCNKLYHECHIRLKYLLQDCPIDQQSCLPIVNTDRLIFQYALDQCGAAELDEVYGNISSCLRRYHICSTLLQVLSQQSNSQNDKDGLKSLLNLVSKRQSSISAIFSGPFNNSPGHLPEALSPMSPPLGVSPI